MHNSSTQAEAAENATLLIEASRGFVSGPNSPLYVGAVLRWAVASAPATESIAGDRSTSISDLR
jgi:hypothetical protein